MTLQLTKFLPSIFMDAMRDNAEGSVIMFEVRVRCGSGRGSERGRGRG